MMPFTVTIFDLSGLKNFERHVNRKSRIVS